MPKRTSTPSRSSTARGTKRSKSTTGVKRIWPSTSKGTGMLFDPFPAKMRSKLRYSQTLSLDPSGGLPAGNLFRCNSIFDPDYTGIGHQPYGHDTLQSIYNHYRVMNSTITMTPTNSNANTNGIFGITLTDDFNVQGDYDTIRELKTTKMSTMLPSNGQATVKNFYSGKQVFGQDQQSTQAAYGNNPAEQQYFHCWSEGSSSAADPNSGDFLITITFEIESWELKDLGQS